MSELHYRCDKPNCYWSVTARSEADIPASRKHQCPHYGTTKIGWSVTQSLLEQCWSEMDGLVDQIYDGVDGEPLSEDAATKAKARMGGIAFALSKFMVPFFRTERDIAKEAKRRYDARKAGEQYETAGLGSLRYQAPPGSRGAGVSGDEGWYPSADGKGFTSDPAQAKQTGMAGGVALMANSRKGWKQLTDTDRSAIVNAKGAFPAKAVAGLYKVPEAQVEDVWANA